MSRVRVVMNGAGAVAVLNSQGVMDHISARVDAACSRANSIGSGVYEADVRPGRRRAHGMVKTTDARSIASNAKHNTLLKSMEAMR